MPGPVQQWDPTEFTIVADGVEVQGYGPDSFITISRKNAMFETTEGCDGQVARSKTNSKIAEIKITLLQTSPTNDQFSALAIIDEKTNAGMFPFFVRDSNGATVVFALQAWFPKIADIARGKGVGTTEWTINTGESTIFAGGNS